MTDPAPTTAPPNIRSAADLLAAGRPTTAPSPADNRPTVMIRYSDLSSPPPEPAGGHNSSGDERAPRPRRTALTWVAISGALLVALGGIVAGAWWLGQNGSDGAGTAQSSGADDGEPGATEPSLGDRLPALPGVAGAHDSTLAVAKGVELGLYPEHSAEILTDHGVAEVIHRASTDDDANYFLLVIPTPDERKAESLADELSSLTTDAGFDRLDDVPGGLTGQLDGRTVRGTWYASGEVAVNLWVSVGEPVRQERLRSLTDDAVGRLHDVLPPG